MKPRPSRRDLAVVAAFALACGLCLWGKPWHVDEPFFLAIARQVLRDPLHPLAFDFNWYGRSQPMAEINNTPPLLPYLLAGALRLSGGGEFATRALLFPLDLAAAWGLLALAALFLRRPLLPTLVLLAGPAWALNLSHAMAERLMAAFAFPALWRLAVAVEERDERAWRQSAVLAALAVASKYNAVFLLGPAVVYARAGGVPWRRVAGWLAVAPAGALAWLAWNRVQGVGSVGAAWAVTAQAAEGFWSSPAHEARALLGFVGGCGIATALWAPALRPGRRIAAATAAAAAVLLWPRLDLAPVVRPGDRALAFALCWGVLASWAALLRGPRERGTALWASWAAAVLLLQWRYWSVLARFILFALPPLVLWAAVRLERTWEAGRLRRLQAATLALTAALAAAVAWVDWRYCASQKDFAAQVAREHLANGRRVWVAAHWGLQEYLVAAGAHPLDAAAGGWDAVKPGDVVVLTRLSTQGPRPSRPVRADVRAIAVESALPLRHMSGWSGEGGFYSSVMGFLPWSISSEPLEEMTIVEVL